MKREPLDSFVAIAGRLRQTLFGLGWRTWRHIKYYRIRNVSVIRDLNLRPNDSLGKIEPGDAIFVGGKMIGIARKVFSATKCGTSGTDHVDEVTMVAFVLHEYDKN